MDITEHKWSDEDVLETFIHDGAISIDIKNDAHSLTILLNKSDAIAIAKHFGLIECKHVFPRKGAQECIKCGKPVLGSTTTDILLSGANGQRIRESIGQMEKAQNHVIYGDGMNPND